MVRHILGVFAFIVILIGCKGRTQQETVSIEGDLYFGHFRIANLYGLPDSIAEKTISYFEDKQITNEDRDTSLFKMYSLLKKEHLLYTPFIQLKTNSDSIITVFLEPVLYKKIAPTNYKALVESKTKLRICVRARHLTEELYLGSKTLSIDSIADNMVHKNGKFKIEDYQ